MFKARKRTSEKWHKKYIRKHNVFILDADGWDRKDFDYSWSKEKITWKEFQYRALRSTQHPCFNRSFIKTMWGKA